MCGLDRAEPGTQRINLPLAIISLILTLSLEFSKSKNLFAQQTTKVDKRVFHCHPQLIRRKFRGMIRKGHRQLKVTQQALPSS